MSMETHVFFRGKLPTKAALSRAMKELGFSFSISPSTGSLMPGRLTPPATRTSLTSGIGMSRKAKYCSSESWS